jgi:hypothetical protein
MTSRVVDPTLGSDSLVIMRHPHLPKIMAEWSEATTPGLQVSVGAVSNPTRRTFSIRINGQNSKILYKSPVGDHDFFLSAVKHDFLVIDPPELPKKANYDQGGVISRPCLIW